jgi:hypothetical protein
MELTMTGSRTVGEVIKDATLYTLREYFMPIRVARRFAVNSYRRVVSPSESSFSETSSLYDPREMSLEAAKLLLRSELSESRSQEKFLLFQSVFAAFLTVLLLIVGSLPNLHGVAPVALYIIVVLTSLLSAFAAIKGVRKREEIVELKTLRLLLKRLDARTAELVIRELAWGKPRARRNSNKHKKPH